MGNLSVQDRTSALVLNRSFTDIDQLAEVLSSRRKIHLTQLKIDQFHCDLRFLEFEEAQFMFVKSLCPGRCIGEKQLADYLTFACVLEKSEDDLTVHGRKVSTDTLCGLDKNRPIDLVIPAQLKYCNVLIKKQTFEECLQIMNRSDIDERFFKAHFLVCPDTLPTVQAYLKQVEHLIEHQPQFLRQSHLSKILLEDFVPLLIDAIPPIGTEPTTPPLLINRAHLVRQAEDYMLTCLDRPLTLKDLCQALNTSSRPLFYGFQEVFGLSPMAYLKHLRMHSVRRKLKVSNPYNTNVQKVAHEFGFWSDGHFAKDYKQMFGEKPSKTLQQ